MMLLQTVGAFVVALGILIVVHEYGHYIVARACGVKVLRFSVGFGKPLLLVRRGADRTEWVLSAIPFGGYVKMLDEREGPVDAAEAGRAFNRQTVWKRIAIVVAGPLFNFLFAIAVYSGLFMYGLPEARPVIAEPGAGSIAKAAGFHAGDTVRSIDGHAIPTWQEFRWRMLKGALQKQALAVEVLDASPTELGGFKDLVLGIAGEGVYRKLQFESGGHRVQRVPDTETKGRIHTSAATVAVLPEPEDVEVSIAADDYRKDLFCASGPGGQHVNKTASAVRLTHLETGLVVQCQDEQSQHKNFAKALRVLKTRIYELRRRIEHEKRADERRTLVGSGDRSQRIRTYNFPQNRLTDHRINESFTLDQILAGRLALVIEAIEQHARQQRKTEMERGAVGQRST